MFYVGVNGQIVLYSYGNQDERGIPTVSKLALEIARNINCIYYKASYVVVENFIPFSSRFHISTASRVLTGYILNTWKNHSIHFVTL